MLKRKDIIILWSIILCLVCGSFYYVNFIMFEGDFPKLKKLGEKRISDEKIDVSWYKTSSITNFNEHIDVSKEGETMKIVKLNEGIINVQIIKSSIIIETHLNKSDFYILKDSVFEYNVVLDTKN